MSSAALMLNEQQRPRSVGKVTKMAAHEIGSPFHSQYFNIDLSPSRSAVRSLQVKRNIKVTKTSPFNRTKRNA